MPLLDAETRTPEVALGRIAWAGPLTIIASVAAVHIVRQLAIRVPNVNVRFAGFGIVPATVDTVILCSLAVIVFAMVGSFHDEAIRRFRWIAFGALLVSFLPLALIGNTATTLGVAAMHVAAYVPCVTLLPYASRSTHTR